MEVKGQSILRKILSQIELPKNEGVNYVRENRS